MRTRVWTLPVLLIAVILAVTAPAMPARAQKSVQDDVNGTCPSGFSLVSATNHPKDGNGNGQICRSSSAQKDRGNKTKDKGSAQSKATRVIDDVNGTCPPDYFLKAKKSPYPEDKNRNGKICVRR